VDPDANIEEQLKLAERINDPNRTWSNEDACRLAELVVALDEWLADGNFVPGRWRHGRGYQK